jgi:membrane fusion protein (multidrug efflux system)
MTLTTVSTVDPIAVAFALPEKFYLDHPEQIARTSVELLRADGAAYPQKGRFDHIERAVQALNRVITVYALFPNPDGVLRPGQYARVRGVPEPMAGAVLVPQRAVSEWQGVDQVMVVKPDDTVEVRTVTTGDRAGSSWIVTSGLKAGERVVVEGMQKCQAGARVTPQVYVAPAQDQPSTNAAAGAGEQGKPN